MKIKVNIPESLSEIKLGTYIDYLQAVDKLEDAVKVKLLTVSMFCKVSEEVVNKMNVNDVNDIHEHLLEIFQEVPECPTFVNLDGIKLGLIPNFDDMTFGEYTDLDTYIGDWNNMHKAMAVLYRPLANTFKDRYLITEYNGTSEWSERMREMPLSVAMGVLVFFYDLGNDLLEHIPNYLTQEVEKMGISQPKHNLGENGDGIHHSINLLKKMFADYPMFQN
jgi:hypothetical protein